MPTDTPFDAPKSPPATGGSKALRVVAIVAMVAIACAGLSGVGTIVALTLLGQSLENSFEEIERSVGEPPQP